MSDRLPKIGTQRMSPKALCRQRSFAVFFMALLSVAQIFCLWLRHAGVTAQTSILEGYRIPVGGFIFGPLKKVRCPVTISALRRQSGWIGLRLNAEVKSKS